MTQPNPYETLSSRAQAIIAGLISTGRAASGDQPEIDGNLIRLNRIAAVGESYWIDRETGAIWSGEKKSEAEPIQVGFVQLMFQTGSN